MATVKYVPEKVVTKKTVVEEDKVTMVLNIAEASLLHGLLGHTTCRGKGKYWGTVAYNLYDALDKACGERVDLEPYNLVHRDINFTGEAAD